MCECNLSLHVQTSWETTGLSTMGTELDILLYLSVPAQAHVSIHHRPIIQSCALVRMRAHISMRSLHLSRRTVSVPRVHMYIIVQLHRGYIRVRLRTAMQGYNRLLHSSGQRGYNVLQCILRVYTRAHRQLCDERMQHNT